MSAESEFPDVLAEADLTAFSAADYPCRVLVAPEHINANAPVAICFLPAPWAEPTLRGMLAVLGAGGGLMLLARNRGDLTRMREDAEMLILAFGGGEPL